MKKFYITTAIDYINAKPHIGHVFEKILTDVIARYHKGIGGDVFFLTGSDEHGIKLQRTAEEAGESPEEFTNRMVKDFIGMKEKFNLSWDRFIRTTEDRHIKASQKLWQLCKEKGDIYEKEYEGLYCEGCESFLKVSDLVDGKCPNHEKEPELVKEKNWFFKLSNYKEKIKNLISSDELKIYPEHRKKEILNILDEIEDFSISRPKEKLSWGVEVPDDPKQNMYVWFDALTNYISGLDWPSSAKASEGKPDEKGNFEKYWPADLHVIGKDIIRFHAVYWPAMLLSAGIEPPKAILVHGFITSGGKKMSKTLGNVVDVEEALNRYGVDALRYFLIREISTTEDGDFTWERFDSRYISDLANSLGNLVSRVTNIAEKNNISFEEVWEKDFIIDDRELEDLLNSYQLDKALEFIWGKVDFCNRYVDDEKPWELKDKKKLSSVINNLLTFIKNIGEKIQPFMPETSEKILKIFKSKKIIKAEPLFPKK